MSAAAAAAEAEPEALNERQEAIKAWYTDRFMRASSQTVALMIAGEFFETDELSPEQYQDWLAQVCNWRAQLTQEASQYDDVDDDSEGEEEVYETLHASQSVPLPGPDVALVPKDGKQEDIKDTPPAKRKRD